jgi:hypothetical protein
MMTLDERSTQYEMPVATLEQLGERLIKQWDLIGENTIRCLILACRGGWQSAFKNGQGTPDTEETLN